MGQTSYFGGYLLRNLVPKCKESYFYVISQHVPCGIIFCHHYRIADDELSRHGRFGVRGRIFFLARSKTADDEISRHRLFL